MILDTKDFKDCCQTILFAIDNKDVSLFTETLELVTDGTNLNLNVTNREYFTTVTFALPEEEKFRASVNAKTFLSLISKITTDTIELKVTENVLKIKANGEYTLPLIYNNDQILELPKIDLGEITSEMVIPGSVLQSILINNSKELLRGADIIKRSSANPVQKYYYIDNQGAITFTSGACVNNFTLSKEIKLLLSDKVVRLFKLFKGNPEVKFYMGQVPISEDIIQTTVRFKTPNIELTAKLTDSALISSVPVSAVRGMATKTYPYTMVIDKNQLMEALNRILLLDEDSRTYGNIIAKGNTLTVQAFSGSGKETIISTGESKNIEEYKMILDLKNLKLVLDGCEEDYITICFGDSRAVVFKKQSVSDIIPELKIS